MFQYIDNVHGTILKATLPVETCMQAINNEIKMANVFQSSKHQLFQKIQRQPIFPHNRKKTNKTK